MYFFMEIIWKLAYEILNCLANCEKVKIYLSSTHSLLFEKKWNCLNVLIFSVRLNRKIIQEFRARLDNKMLPF